MLPAPTRTAVTCLLLFVAAFVVFRASPRGQIYDSKYTLVVSHQLVQHGTLALDDLAWRIEEKEQAPLSYRFVERNGHVRPLFPVGTPILVAPAVAAATVLGYPVIDANGEYDRSTARSLQRTLAAIAMAALACVFFLTARLLLPDWPSLWIALGGAFGSQVWSTASRSLWSHGFAIGLLACALFLLLRARVAERALPTAGIASLLAWAWLCRPTLALSIAALTLWVAWCERHALARFIGVGALWGMLFGAFFWLDGDSPLPPYYATAQLGLNQLGVALAGQLISPSRGLLIYCPLVLAVAHLLWKHWSTLPHRSLAIAGIATFFAHWLLISSFTHWWGGYGYGARLMTDIVPWVVFLGAIGLSAALAARPDALNRLECWVMGALVVTSIAINGVGAISKGAAQWNDAQQRPGFEQKLWDWRDPQVLHRRTR